MVDEKTEVEEDVEKKKEQKVPIWQKIPPLYLVIGAIFVYFAIRSMMMDTENQTYVIFIIIIVAVWILLAQAKPVVDTVLTPRDAELLTERELERKKRWGQLSLMSHYDVGPVSDLMHRDARGQYYNVAVKVTDPFYKPQHYTAKVMASGFERGFCTITESIGRLDGRGVPQEKDIVKVPDWLRRSEQYPYLKDIWSRR